MRRVPALAAVLAAALALAACGSAPAGSLSGTPAASPAVSAAQPALTSPVRGVVLHVDSPSLGKVDDFTLLTDDNRQVVFKVGVLENGAEFPAAHLPEHVASSEPILVYFRVQGSDLVVYRLEDGSAASPSAS